MPPHRPIDSLGRAALKYYDLMSSSIQYRPEIDGLRALAIASVVAFHLGASWIPGGFVGVDVFFVISGFLITSIIARQQAAGTFGLREFWLRRARRLLPALGVLLAMTLVAGYLLLVGGEFRFLGIQIASTLSFWANVCMYRNAGNYWGPEAEDFSLLHCWSLSVEEQFYIVFPLGMLFLHRLGSSRMKWILLAAAAASFGLAVFGARRYPAAAFYLLPTRAWELLVGCLLALAQTQLDARFSNIRTRGMLADLGGLMVLASFFVVRKGAWFPAPAGLLPTLGAALVIGLGRDSGWVRRFLSLSPVVYLGRISYSWYLWHWPVIVLSRQAAFEETWAQFAAGLTLGIASYHLIEVPTRSFCETRILRGIILPVAAVGLLAFFIPRVGLRSSGNYEIPTDWCDAHLTPSEVALDGSPGCIQPPLVRDWQSGIRRATPIPGPVQAVLLGDSHAKAWLPALDTVFGELGWNYTAFPAPATSPFFVPSGRNPFHYGRADMWPGTKRLELDQYRRAYLTSNQPPFVVIGARWFTHRDWSRSEFDAGISNLLVLLPRSQFLLIGQPPQLPFGEEGFHRIGDDIGLWTQFKEQPTSRAGRERVHGWIREFTAQNPRIHFLESADHFLEDDRIRLHVGRLTLYRDDDHVSVEGAMRLTGVFRQALLECSKAAANQQP